MGDRETEPRDGGRFQAVRPVNHFKETSVNAYEQRFVRRRHRGQLRGWFNEVESNQYDPIWGPSV